MALMGAARMHADDIETDVALIRRLLSGQFPQWMDLPISRVTSYGTDNDIYRLGDRMREGSGQRAVTSCYRSDHVQRFRQQRVVTRLEIRGRGGE